MLYKKLTIKIKMWYFYTISIKKQTVILTGWLQGYAMVGILSY
jgi:hypothetical protein